MSTTELTNRVRHGFQLIGDMICLSSSAGFVRARDIVALQHWGSGVRVHLSADAGRASIDVNDIAGAYADGEDHVTQDRYVRDLTHALFGELHLPWLNIAYHTSLRSDRIASFMIEAPSRGSKELHVVAYLDAQGGGRKYDAWTARHPADAALGIESLAQRLAAL